MNKILPEEVLKEMKLQLILLGFIPEGARSNVSYRYIAPENPYANVWFNIGDLGTFVDITLFKEDGWYQVSTVDELMKQINKIKPEISNGSN